MNIGSAIKHIRKQKNFSQGELAGLIGISQTALSQIEIGLSVPSQKTLNKICDVLKVPPALLYIIGIDENDVPEDRKILFKALYPSFKVLAIQMLGPDQEKFIES